MNALARASSNCKRQTHPMMTMTAGVQLKKNLLLSLKGLGAKTN
jgi:hypothetical protein